MLIRGSSAVAVLLTITQANLFWKQLRVFTQALGFGNCELSSLNRLCRVKRHFHVEHCNPCPSVPSKLSAQTTQSSPISAIPVTKECHFHSTTSRLNVHLHHGPTFDCLLLDQCGMSFDRGNLDALVTLMTCTDSGDSSMPPSDPETPTTALLKGFAVVLLIGSFAVFTVSLSTGTAAFLKWSTSSSHFATSPFSLVITSSPGPSKCASFMSLLLAVTRKVMFSVQTICPNRVDLAKLLIAACLSLQEMIIMELWRKFWLRIWKAAKNVFSLGEQARCKRSTSNSWSRSGGWIPNVFCKAWEVTYSSVRNGAKKAIENIFQSTLKRWAGNWITAGSAMCNDACARLGQATIMSTGNDLILPPLSELRAISSS